MYSEAPPQTARTGPRESVLPTGLRRRIEERVDVFVRWLDGYGWWSRDHQSWYAGPVGGRAKALYYSHPWPGTLAVAPMVLGEALVPTTRHLFHRPLRFPIADAHYGMGFAYLYQVNGRPADYTRATSLLEALLASRCPEYRECCWGYPFDWVTRNGTIRANTPLITSTPYAYEAFLHVYRIDNDPRWLATLESIVRHVLSDIRDFDVSERASTCSYTPHDRGGVVNASAYRAFLLASAAIDLGCSDAFTPGERNLQFVLDSQNTDGSWPYAIDGERHFVDHFHTCFVLKALAKIDLLSPTRPCEEAIDRGLDYYLANLLDGTGLPKPFAKAPRLTVYRRELYDYAECLNLCLLLRHRRPELDALLVRVAGDLLDRWRHPRGSFRSRELLLGWDNVPMHRWAQSQMFRSLAFLLYSQTASGAAACGGQTDHVRHLRPV